MPNERAKWRYIRRPPTARTSFPSTFKLFFSIHLFNMIVPDYILDSLSMIGLIAGRADDATLDVEQICGTGEYFALALSADIVIRFMLDEVLNEGGEFDAIDVLKRLSWIKLH